MLFEHDDAAALQRFRQLLEMRQQQPHLTVGVALGSTAEENHRRVGLVPACQQRPEIGVGRHQDTRFLAGAVEDDGIGGGSEPIGSDVNRIVSRALQCLRHPGGEWVVNQKPQLPLDQRTVERGSSRSRTASAA